MSLKRNVIANFAGSGWLALMGLAFVPFYINLLGVESYGVVGIFVTLQSLFLVLDMGLTQSISRELARLSALEDGLRHMPATLRTMELVYWGIAGAVALSVALLAYPIAHFWVNTTGLSVGQVFESILLIALIMGLRWPVSLYIGALNGLQAQVVSNKYLAFFATLQGVGALAALLYIEPTLTVFFCWQALVAAIQLYCFRRYVAKLLAVDSRTRFEMNVLRGIWRFAAGMTGISLLTTVLTQLDKVLLSKILSLKDFGLYIFATTVASVLVRVVAPIFTSYSPRLTALVASDPSKELDRIYHQACQLMAVLIVPAALVLAFFGQEIILIWTRDLALASSSALIISYLVLGNMFNGLVTIPYALQLAHGWTRFAFFQNIAGVMFLGPALYFLSIQYGGVGAAFCWMVLNFCYFMIGIPVMYRWLMKGRCLEWFFYDVAIPSLPALILCSLTKALIIPKLALMWQVFTVSMVWGVSVVLALAFSRNLRIGVWKSKLSGQI